MLSWSRPQPPPPPRLDPRDTPRRRATRWSPSPTDSMCRSTSCGAGTISKAQPSHRATLCMFRNQRESLPREAIIAQRPARTQRNPRIAQRRRRHRQARQNRRPRAPQRERNIILLRHDALLACVRWLHVSCCCYNPARVSVLIFTHVARKDFLICDRLT